MITMAVGNGLLAGADGFGAGISAMVVGNRIVASSFLLGSVRCRIGVKSRSHVKYICCCSHPIFLVNLVYFGYKHV